MSQWIRKQTEVTCLLLCFCVRYFNEVKEERRDTHWLIDGIMIISIMLCVPIHYNTFFFWYAVVVPLYMYLNDVNKCFCWDRCLFQFSLNKNIVILFVKRDDDTSSKEIQIFSLISKGMKEHLILILTSHIFRSHITWQHFYSPIMQNGVTQKKNTQQCIFIYLFYQSAMKKCMNDLFTRN